MMLSVSVACGEDRSAGGGEALTGAPPTWVTEAEYRFGGSADGEVFFTRPTVRTDPARGRVFAVDRPNSQVSAWTLDGTLLFRVGQKGEGPGEFIDMGSLHIETDAPTPPQIRPGFPEEPFFLLQEENPFIRSRRRSSADRVDEQRSCLAPVTQFDPVIKLRPPEPDLRQLTLYQLP